LRTTAKEVFSVKRAVPSVTGLSVAARGSTAPGTCAAPAKRKPMMDDG
jgi:hypothetical protein